MDHCEKQQANVGSYLSMLFCYSSYATFIKSDSVKLKHDWTLFSTLTCKIATSPKDPDIVTNKTRLEGECLCYNPESTKGIRAATSCQCNQAVREPKTELESQKVLRETHCVLFYSLYLLKIRQTIQ